MIHKVVTRREPTFPFSPYWACVCGHRLKAEVMGNSLYREFAEHKENQDGEN